MDDPLILARAQFGLNVAFHILFPSLTIALGWVLLGMRIACHRTGDPGWLKSYKLWTKIFALTFAMGVVTGIVMSFQFGTNWPGFMNKVGAIAGPLLGYEVMTAFFLEATFLGVMLFGMNRVPAWAHIGATALVAFGTTLSAFWILALNSWMHTPAGHVLDGNQWIAADWLAVIFNPSFPYRFSHMMVASGLTAAFVVGGLSAWRLLKAPPDALARRTLRLGIGMAAVLAPLQAFIGDMHGLNTLEHQPAKIAAVEAIWHTERGAPLVLFAIPNEKTKRNDFAVEIPHGASLILKHELNGELKGLDSFGKDHPPVLPVFFSFRIMVGIGLAMIAVSWLSVWLTRRGRAAPRWLLWTLAGFTFSGWVATVAGWLVTEIGRQPWIVQGILRTAEATGTVTSGELGLSLAGYSATYAMMFVAYLVVLTHMAGQGAEVASVKPIPGASPLGAAAD